jgi:hypothetical protein
MISRLLRHVAGTLIEAIPDFFAKSRDRQQPEMFAVMILPQQFDQE